MKNHGTSGIRDPLSGDAAVPPGTVDPSRRVVTHDIDLIELTAEIVASFVSYLMGGGTIHVRMGPVNIEIRGPRRPGHHA